MTMSLSWSKLHYCKLGYFVFSGAYRSSSSLQMRSVKWRLTHTSFVSIRRLFGQLGIQGYPIAWTFIHFFKYWPWRILLHAETFGPSNTPSSPHLPFPASVCSDTAPEDNALSRYLRPTFSFNLVYLNWSM